MITRLTRQSSYQTKHFLLTRREWFKVYDKSVLGFDPGPMTTSRRVILEFLSRPEVAVKDILDTISTGSTPKDWLVVGVHPKEREMKIEPRLFAMLTLEMRIYYCSTEKNIAETIFPFFPQQTMTLDETQLKQRLFESSNPKTSSCRFREMESPNERSY